MALGMMWRRLWLAGVVLLALRVDAQPRVAAPAAPLPAFTISVLTFGPGDQVFEKFGHNALRIRDHRTGSDLAYNWGMFSFNEPNFLGRFLSGTSRYWVAAYPTEQVLEVYAASDRSIVEQRLALPDSVAAALVARVEANALEENKYYAYDYYRDNCSTRLRDHLDAVLGGALRTQLQAQTAERKLSSYRTESLRLMWEQPLTRLGINIALGRPADRPIDGWEESFVPMRLRDRLAKVQVGGVPLVRDTRVLYEARRMPEPPSYAPSSPLTRLLTIVIPAMLVVGGMAVLALRYRASRTLGALTMVWALLSVLIAAVLLGMWFGSAHVFWYRNPHLFLFSPLALGLFPVAWRAMRGRALPAWARPLAWTLTGSTLLAWIVVSRPDGFILGAIPFLGMLPLFLVVSTEPRA
ncbi:MAG: DUF4105 domain-containing protein [Gemmatimonadaceae bacterium]|nr:DUF4105 domain-containing protein [Gemmatimonadaceae bacterium]